MAISIPFRLHWWTPFMMVSSFFVGILFAFGHHFFYQSLVNKPTSRSDYTVMGNQLPGQQYNIAIGTAISFLVKAAFVLGASTAYCQVFWKRAKQDSKLEKPPTLARLDTTFSAPTNLSSLLNAPVWFRYPLLFLMAATVWLIPIASIITPATLSVDLRENVANSTMQQVPQIDFCNLNFIAGMPSHIYNKILHYTYNGPSQIVEQIAMGVAAQNAILPIAPPFPNSSSTLDFTGPSLKCNPVSPSEYLKFQANIAQYIKDKDIRKYPDCIDFPTYISWFPRYDIRQGKTFNEPYNNRTSGNTSTIVFLDPEQIFSPISFDYKKTAQDGIMYIAVVPKALSFSRFEPYNISSLSNPCGLDDPESTTDNPLGRVGEDVSMLQCQQYNSTYQTKFNYTNGAQVVSIALARQEEDNSVSVINFVRGAELSSQDYPPCAALREVGKVEQDHKNACEFDKSLLSRLSYQGILQAFAMMLTGNIRFITYTRELLDTTRIRSTSLLSTKELYYLTDYGFHTSDGKADLQKSLEGTNKSEFGGMSRLRQDPPERTLKDAIETMFQNFTVSLMSSSALQPNYSSPETPPKVMVTHYTAQTVYIYAADKLWAAYGIAALFTFCSVIVGMLTIVADGASYSSAFSTVLRVARGAELSIELQELNLEGKNPLSSDLAKATVTISGSKNRGLKRDT